MALHLDHGALDVIAEDRDLRDVLADIFMLLGAKYDLPPEVQGSVTINLHNVTYQQALETVLGSEYTCTIGPHDVIYVHKGGTTWMPGKEEAA